MIAASPSPSGGFVTIETSGQYATGAYVESGGRLDMAGSEIFTSGFSAGGVAVTTLASDLYASFATILNSIVYATGPNANALNAYGLGAALQLSRDSSLYAEYDYTNGDRYGFRGTSVSGSAPVGKAPKAARKNHAIACIAHKSLRIFERCRLMVMLPRLRRGRPFWMRCMLRRMPFYGRCRGGNLLRKIRRPDPCSAFLSHSGNPLVVR